MTLPATGGTWAEVIEPSLNPLAVRYWQITDAFIRDYLTINGIPLNLADPACGLGIEGLFTPFAADGLTIRKDLLWSSNGGQNNQGWFHLDELKEDSTAITPDQTVQQTPTAQSVRTVRDVLTKLDDKISITPITASDLVNRLRFELPLAGWTPRDGMPGYQLSRGATDVLVERQVILMGVDTDGQLLAEVYPRVVTDKKGKTELQRKNPQSLELSYSILPDPLTKKTMWICRAGAAWNAQGNFDFETTMPVVSPSATATSVLFPTPTDVGDAPVYSYALQQAAGGQFVSGAPVTGAPTVNGKWSTLSIPGIAAGQYNALVLTVVNDGETVATTPPSAPFTVPAGS